MAFGPTNTAQRAQSGIEANSNLAAARTGPQYAAGTNLLNAGTGMVNSGANTVQSGTNYFNTLLNGNQQNTTALLQPDIDRIRAGNQNAIQSLSTLMPRGGGRSGTLFGAAYAPQAQIGSLFNGARGAAGGQLAQIGLGQQGIGLGQESAGTNLFNTANAGLATGLAGQNSLFGNAMAGKQSAFDNWVKFLQMIGQGVAGAKAGMDAANAGATGASGAAGG